MVVVSIAGYGKTSHGRWERGYAEYELRSARGEEHVCAAMAKTLRQRGLGRAADEAPAADSEDVAKDVKATPATAWWGWQDAVIAAVILAIALYSRLVNIRDPRYEVFDETVRAARRRGAHARPHLPVHSRVAATCSRVTHACCLPRTPLLPPSSTSPSSARGKLPSLWPGLPLLRCVSTPPPRYYSSGCCRLNDARAGARVAVPVLSSPHLPWKLTRCSSFSSIPFQVCLG